MMKGLGYVAGIVGTLCSVGALAQQPAELGIDQKIYIAYHYCMMQAAMKSSHTETLGEDIYDLAYGDCAAVRAQASTVKGQFPELEKALDAADSEKKANFPAWIKGVRERRASFSGSVAPAR